MTRSKISCYGVLEAPEQELQKKHPVSQKRLNQNYKKAFSLFDWLNQNYTRSARHLESG
jgi:hypothetical protein